MAGRCLTHAGGPVWGRCQQGEGRGAVLPGPSVDGGLIRQPPVLIVRGTPGWRSGTGTALLGAISRFGGSGDLRVFEHGCECVNWWQRVGVSAGLRGMPGGGVPVLGWLLSRGDQPAAGDGARATTKKFADPEDAPAPYPVREDDQRAHRPQLACAAQVIWHAVITASDLDARAVRRVPLWWAPLPGGHHRDQAVVASGLRVCATRAWAAVGWAGSRAPRPVRSSIR